jgi:hypothetical protein
MKRIIMTGLMGLLVGAVANCGSSLPQVRQSLESNKKIIVVYQASTHGKGGKIHRSMWDGDMQDKNWLAQMERLEIPVPQEFKTVNTAVVEALKEAYPGYTVLTADSAPADKDGIVAFVMVSGRYKHSDEKYTLGMSTAVYFKDLKKDTSYLGMTTDAMGSFRTEPVEIREADALREKNQIMQAADLVSAKIDPVKAALPGLKAATKKGLLEYLARVKAAKAE